MSASFFYIHLTEIFQASEAPLLTKASFAKEEHDSQTADESASEPLLDSSARLPPSSNQHPNSSRCRTSSTSTKDIALRTSGKKPIEQLQLDDSNMEKGDLVGKINGNFGRWQLRTVLLIFLCKIPSSWFMACIIYTGMVCIKLTLVDFRIILADCGGLIGRILSQMGSFLYEQIVDFRFKRRRSFKKDELSWTFFNLYQHK